MHLQHDLRLFRVAMDATTDGIYIVDRTSLRFIDVNAGACAMLGLTREEILTSGPEGVLSMSRHELAQLYDSVIATVGHTTTHEVLRPRPDGTQVWIEIRRQAQRVGEGWIIVTVARDVTTRRQTEEALRQSEVQLECILGSTDEGILAVDHNGKVIRFNQRFGQLWHLPEALLESKDDQALLGFVLSQLSEPQEFLNKVQALYLSDAVATDTISFNDGRTFERFTAPLVLDGELVGRVWSFREITERRLAEAALRESEERYRTAFKISPDAVNINRLADGVVLEVNDSFSRLLGWTREEVLGKHLHEFKLWRNKHDRDALRDALQRDGRCENLETQLLAKDGKSITALISSHVMQLNGVPCVLSVTHDITARKKAEEQIHNLAFSDALTGLPNRRLLTDRLEQTLADSRRYRYQCALLLIDLDDFKMLNDTRGHDEGDLLLQQVGQRLRACVRKGDTVARLGGDEFVVLLEHLSADVDQAAREAEVVGGNVLTSISQLYQLNGYTYRSTASIGITLFGAQHESFKEPLKRADLAMYQAKAAGRNVMRFFDHAMQASVNAQVALELGLREAVNTHQFVLHYQAQVSASGRITGVEALVRWQHPQRGLVGPVEFIAQAEQSGLILPLGQWVLEAACAQLVGWAVRPEMAHLSMAVNVSARQFHQDNFVDQVLDTLACTGASADRLKLELTESLLVANIEDVIVKLNALKAHGVGFSLDDFGTGYSSLAYLKRLPLDQLKIDRSFITNILTDPNDAAIAKMIMALADSMGLAVIAEGVETQAQREFLAGLGCLCYQGYLFSRPLPLEEFEALCHASDPVGGLDARAVSTIVNPPACQQPP